MKLTLTLFGVIQPRGKAEAISRNLRIPDSNGTCIICINQAGYKHKVLERFVRTCIICINQV